MSSSAKDRLACVNVPEPALQLLLRRHPDWAEFPVAVVDEDRPQGRILLVNERARGSSILPGMSFAQGLSLHRDLRAAVVPPEEVGAGVRELVAALAAFSPAVEPWAEEPGIFFLDARGLARLYSSASAWTREILRRIEGLGLAARVVVGYSRFGVYAASKTARRWTLFVSPEQEAAAVRVIGLDRLAIDPDARDRLAKLGVRTVGDLAALPASALRRRFGPDIRVWHDRACGRLLEPLRPMVLHKPAAMTVQIEPPDGDALRLLFLIKTQTHPLLTHLARAGQAASALELRFSFDRAPSRTDVLRPAEPTLDEKILIDLVRLRLDAAPLPDAVNEITLVAHDAPAAADQLRLFFARPKRDLDAANRALARLRAELGVEAVARVRLRDAHLPEARFAFEPLERVAMPKECRAAIPMLVRRLRMRPSPLPPSSLPPFGRGPETRAIGPFVVSGGWWKSEVSRRYYFVETSSGALTWVFYDERRRGWFLHGGIE